MSQTSGLTVRQHERAGIRVPVEFVVSDRHAGQVQFSSASSSIDVRTIAGEAVDISAGGLGMECRQFLPRMCEGRVRVYDPRPTGYAGDGSPIRELLLEHPVRVRRVYLIGREPSYAVGMAFIDPDPETDQRIAAMLERLSAMEAGAGVSNAGGRGNA